MDIVFRHATDADADRVVRLWYDSGASITPLGSVEHVRRLNAHPAAHIVRHLGQLA